MYGRHSILAVVDDTNLTGLDSLRAKKMIAVGKPIQQSVASGEAEIQVIFQSHASTHQAV